MLQDQVLDEKREKVAKPVTTAGMEAMEDKAPVTEEEYCTVREQAAVSSLRDQEVRQILRIKMSIVRKGGGGLGCMVIRVHLRRTIATGMYLA